MTDPRKPVFDATRTAKGSALSNADVAALDTALDTIGIPRGTTTGKHISATGLALIEEFEGLRLKAYPDPATGGDPWTIGIGTTVYPNGQKVKPGDTCTEAQAQQYLAHDVTGFEKSVAELCPVTTQSQFDALVSFTYNLGAGNLSSSTLRKKHNAGDYAGAANEFVRWNKANGKVMAGLTRRREAEAELYRGQG